LAHVGRTHRSRLKLILTKETIVKSLFITALILFSSNGFSKIIFDQIRVMGTGCPAGSVTVVPSPDGDAASILFDSFRIEVPDGGTTRRRPTPGGAGSNIALVHKMCLVGFTSTLPENEEATALEISVQARGSTMLDQGLSASFIAGLESYSGLVASRTPQIVVKKDWIASRGPLDEEWTQAPTVVVPLAVKCARGHDRQIRLTLKNHISATTILGDATKHGMIAVDSNDISQGLIKVRLKTRRCGGTIAPIRR